MEGREKMTEEEEINRFLKNPEVTFECEAVEINYEALILALGYYYHRN